MPTRKTRPPSSRDDAGERRRATQELRALAHPIRLRLLELFAGTPRTTMQVAALMNEPPTRLYHHVNALEKAGLLELRETRPNRGTTEKYFATAKRRIGVSSAGELGKGDLAPARSALSAVFEEGRRELLAALPARGARSKGRSPIALRMVMSVPPSRLPAVRRRLMATIDALKREAGARGRDHARSEHWALTLVFTPSLARAAGPAAPGEDERAPAKRRRVKRRAARPLSPHG